MTITTKSALAAELAISKARVSQYVKAGLPVRSDGRLNREEALNWISRNQPSQTFEDKGAHRARKITKQKREARRTVSAEEVDREFHMAVELVGMSDRIVASAALQAGLSIEAAYALAMMIPGELDEVACRILAENGHEGFPAMTVGEFSGRKYVPDFGELARKHGLHFDENACEAFADRVMFPPGWRPPHGSPAERLARGESDA